VTGGGALRCYECRHRYRYLGRGLHPGRCPRCGSHCVSPADEVTVLATFEGSTDRERPAVTVLAIDERRRHFRYRVRRTGDALELVTLEVDGHIVRPTARESAPPVPAAIREHLSQDVRGSRPERDREWRVPSE